MGEAGRARRMLVVVAHPDDETFGLGSVVAMVADAGAEVTVCCATRGEAGEPAPGSGVAVADLPAVREAELRAAGQVLGVARIVLLDFRDSGMSGPCPPDTLVGAPLDDVVDAVARVLDDERPDLVVTLDETGADGHRDHARIATATTAAVRRRPGPHLYQWCLARSLLRQWLGHLAAERPDSGHLDLDATTLGRPDDDVTTVLDVAHVVGRRRRAVAEHRSQESPFDVMPPELQAAFLHTDRLVRVEPPWDGGARETALSWPAAPLR